MYTDDERTRLVPTWYDTFGAATVGALGLRTKPENARERFDTRRAVRF